jgi:hypothetical protein
MKRRLAETQEAVGPQQMREEQAKQLADQISMERAKKRRLEWYLSEVLKEKEQLMRENSEWADKLVLSPPQPSCTSDEDPPSLMLKEGSTSSPICSEEGLRSTLSPRATPQTLDESLDITEELCCGSAPPYTAAAVTGEQQGGLEYCNQPTGGMALTTSLYPTRPCCEPSSLDAWIVDAANTAFCRGSSSCAREPTAEKEVAQQCLDLDVHWLANTDEQDLISTLQEYFS